MKIIWQHSNLNQANTHRKLVETRAIIVKFGGRKSSAVKEEDSLSNLALAAEKRCCVLLVLISRKNPKRKEKLITRKESVVCHFVNGHCLASMPSHGRRNRRRKEGDCPPPLSIVADQLTLFRPGVEIMTPIFRPSYGPVSGSSDSMKNVWFVWTREISNCLKVDRNEVHCCIVREMGFFLFFWKENGVIAFWKKSIL